MKTLNLLLILSLFVLIQDSSCAVEFFTNLGKKVKETAHKGWVAVGLGQKKSYDLTSERPTTQVTTVERYIKKKEEDYTKTTINPASTNGKQLPSTDTKGTGNSDDGKHALFVAGSCPQGSIKSRSGICMPAQNGGSL